MRKTEASWEGYSTGFGSFISSINLDLSSGINATSVTRTIPTDTIGIRL